MKTLCLAAVAALLLVCGACAPHTLTAPSPSPTSATIRDGEGRAVARPLFVVDGRVMDEGKAGEIAPADILNVQVLKGEPAVKTYGARGANGVVIVTTRHAAAPGTAARVDGRAQRGPPLYVIDGVVVPGAEARRGVLYVPGREIDPGDIVEVKVLLGAQAVPIYGEAAANGAVVITTRHPAAGR